MKANIIVAIHFSAAYAKNMKKEGITAEIIGRVTGLTAEQIAAL